MIACLDVGYRGDDACAACVVIEHWSDAAAVRTYRTHVAGIAPYAPGHFYRRELPCLLAVLKQLPAIPEIVVIDGYVWLSARCDPGLGAYLHSALSGACAVVGVAKTQFAGVSDSPLVAHVLRGTSARPLYVTSVGIDLNEAASQVQAMSGQHRIPVVLRLVDQLARGIKTGSMPAASP